MNLRKVQIIKNLLQEIKIKENGPVSDSMSRMGLIYKKNHGVSIQELKDLAKKYEADTDLAANLREMNIRETMILGIFLEDRNNITDEKIEHIVQNIPNIEIAEQTCMNLLENIPTCFNKAYNWVQSESEFVKVTAYILYSRLALKNINLENSFFEKLINFSSSDFENKHYHVRMSLSRALRNIALRNHILKGKVLNQVEKIKHNKSEFSSLIYEEVAELLKY